MHATHCAFDVLLYRQIKSILYLPTTYFDTCGVIIENQFAHYSFVNGCTGIIKIQRTSLGLYMQALDLLLNRRSQPRLIKPAPAGEALENILQAGFAAPDHHCLSPWRFIVCTDKGLSKLGGIFEDAAIVNDKGAESIARAPQLPLRAPMVIVAICHYKAHEKVPKIEQIASTACAVQSMQMAAVAQGFQGIWRTGWYAQDEQVKASLNCTEDDEILGFLYLGSTSLKPLKRKPKVVDNFVEMWT